MSDLDDFHSMLRLIMENVRQGIFTFGEDKVIHEPYSRFLKTILNVSDLKECTYDEILFKDSNLNRDRVSQIEACVSSSINENIFQYNLNSALLPNEITKKVGDQFKILELDWLPIENSDRLITKIMVTVRDVTELRESQKQAQNQTRRLTMIGQLLAMPRDRIEPMLSSALAQLCEAKDMLIAGQRKGYLSREATRTIFSILHTIKGNARTYHLDEVTGAIHAAEDFYSKYLKEKENLRELSFDKEVETLKSILSKFGEYTEIYEKRLKKISTEANLGNTRVLEKVHHLLRRDRIEELKQFVQDQLYISLKDALNPLKDSLPGLAVALGKKVPSLVFSGPIVYVSRSQVETLLGVFSHLFRNSIDHGIKSDQDGQIKVESEINLNGTLSLYVEDNGQGLDIKALTKKAIELYGADRDCSIQEVADIIFEPGVSTASQVTEISGRGIGMDAVRGILKQKKGNITIILKSQSKQGKGFIPFRFKIDLPSSFFELNQFEKVS